MRSSDKGEKEERNALNYRRAVVFSPFLKFMRQPLQKNIPLVMWLLASGDERGNLEIPVEDLTIVLL